MAKLGMAQITARSNTNRAVARRAGRSITFYLLRVRATNENRGLEIRLRRGGCRSVQLKIKRHGRNHFDLLAVHGSRFCPPLFHGGDGGIGERWFAFNKFLHFVRIFADSATETAFKPVEPAFEPVGLGFWWSRRFG